MYPWGHLALGYLFYSVASRVTRGTSPDGRTVVSLALGTQFPDLVDKPLAWTFGVLPSGRTLAHSVFTTAVVIGVVLYLTRQRHSAAGSAFSFGYASHLLGDVIEPLLAGTYSGMEFLFWPLLGPVAPDLRPSFVEHFLSLEFPALLLEEFHLVVLLLLVWLVDGMPVVADLARLAWRRFYSGSPG